MVGKIGEHYEVVQELRRGAWVTVYEARHTILGRRTLIKWLNPGGHDDEELVGRLRREARLGASVDHRNVARIYEVGDADNLPYVAIEWIKGDDLDKVLERDGSFSADKAIRLAADLLSGLSAIHNAGIVHRDLSPMNVRITENGRARITDFGLATGPFKVNYTMPGSIVGTPGYLAPEQAAGKAVDVRADLFACGVLIHEAITGEPLFKEDDLLATIKKVRHHEASPLEDLYSELPKGFDGWINRLLDKNPENRFPSATKALRELGKLTGDSTLLNLKDKTSSRKRIFVTTGLAIPLIIASLILPNYLGIDTLITLPTMYDSTSFSESSSLQDSVEQENDKSETKNLVTPEEEITAIDTPFTEVRNSLTEEEAFAEKNPQPSSTIDPVIESEPLMEEGPGWIQIKTQPWATVYMNAVRIGSTPNLPVFESASGQINLTLHNPGFPPIPLDTTLKSSDTLSLSIDLLDHVTTLQITAVPWANISLDEAPVGSTPLQAPIYISPGDHVLKLEHPEFGLVLKEFTAEKGRALTIHSNIEKEGTKFASSSVGGSEDE